jgi:hypothetical protein
VIEFILSMLAVIRVFFRARRDTALEILALRQQVAVLKRKRPRPPLNAIDRLFWTVLRRLWSRWSEVLVIVKPETVIAWHRAGFRLYWRWCSRPHGGRPKVTEEIRELIRRLADENPDWGAPKIHGELQKLGFVVSERTCRPVSRTPAPPRQRSQAMACISSQPPRGDRRVRSLHRADVDVPVAVLLQHCTNVSPLEM